ncbi:MAG: MBL fold metallo-hydrolase [Pseudomonadales bacterium]|nr:MBL fold metallo-hydrolase [Pseudomonadales bacterium]
MQRSALVTMFLTILMSAVAHGQGQNFDQVQIKTTRISSNFATLEGRGGMTGILSGPDGVFMVDTQFAPLTDKIVAAVKAITAQPIRFVVNTHLHGDHTGGNANLGAMGAMILSHDQLRSRLAHPNPGANGQPGTPAPAAALPMLTYDGTVTLYLNGEEVRLIPIASAHTDGDTLIQFVNNDILMVGDFYRSIQFPNIDRSNGGSLAGMLAGLATVIGTAGPDTRIIPGHGPTVDRSAVVAHRDMILDLRDKVAALVQQGKTQEEVIAANPAAAYENSVQQIGTTRDRFIGQLYAELKAQQ